MKAFRFRTYLKCRRHTDHGETETHGSALKGTVRLEFKKEASEWGLTSIISYSELYDSSAGYLLNDICVIEAKVDIPIKNNDQGPEFSATVEPSIKKEPIGWELSDVNSEQAPDSIAAPNTPHAELVPTVQDTPGSCIVKPGFGPKDQKMA